eukprot:181507-Prorocentrum_minimum.AAC.1
MSRCPDVQVSHQSPPPTTACLTPHGVGSRCSDVQMSRCPANPPPTTACLTPHQVGSKYPDVQMSSQHPSHSRLSDPSSSGFQMSGCPD